MKCPICKNDLELKSRKVGEDANGNAINNEFAICHTCKKQWNLDKQRAKKAQQRAAAAREAAAKEAAAAKSEAPDGETKIMEPISREELAKVAEAQPKRKRPVNPDAAVAPERPVRRRPAPQEAVASEVANLDAEEEVSAPRKRKPIDNSKSSDPMFSNIPPKHVRDAREKEMRENYQMMLDEDDEDEEEKHPILTAILILLIIALLAVIGFGCYWYFFM